MQSKIFSANKTLNAQGRFIDLSAPKVMGILNVTSDSFYEGSRLPTVADVLQRAETMVLEGADFLDVGGYSSRPGATDISESEELKRVIPVIEALRKKLPDVMISIDTFRSEVAQAALYAGADMINDITGGNGDSNMYSVAAHAKAPYVLMHMRGTPQTMKHETEYDDLEGEMIDYFHARLDKLKQAGVKDVIIDPGFGFAKTIKQSFELLQNLQRFRILEKPLLVGLSRKSMIWRTLETTPEHALNGTSVVNTIALLKGASILRVHDVRAAREAITLTSQLA
ncbi:MAG TPA: dihydropteroate synthase [Cyclobacteriaceae bacterium]|nr:dihydropteroate synthase [Cyclobacteriaceae bacterium]HNT50718.1 dihydropteroate synthase [Cyclobacteriaceae bacterium]